MTCCTRSKMLLASIQRVSDFLIPRAPSLKFEKVPSFHCCSRRFERNFLPSGRDLISSHEASSCQASQSNGALNFPNFWNHFLKRCNPDMGTKWPEIIPPYISFLLDSFSNVQLHSKNFSFSFWWFWWYNTYLGVIFALYQGRDATHEEATSSPPAHDYGFPLLAVHLKRLTCLHCCCWSWFNAPVHDWNMRLQ